MTVPRSRVTVIGIGLIGGSLLRALAAAGTPVCGYDADPVTRASARRGDRDSGRPAPWRIADSVDAAVADFAPDLVVLAVPLPAVPGVLDALSAAGHRGLLSDVTSVKAPVADLTAGWRHVGGHPMVGREVSGFGAGRADLFVDRPWALCLEPETSLDDWLTLAALVTGIGARVVPTTAREHDAAVARISHVPHLLAAALAAAVTTPLATGLAAGSFRDGTRVAASPPELVAAMCGGNARAVRESLDVVLEDLGAARALLDGPDPVTALTEWLARGHAVRGGWPPVAGPAREISVTREVLLDLGRRGGWITGIDVPTRTAVAVLPRTTDPGT